MKLEFSSSELANLRNSLSREWLETNGCGGYASGTVVNCHTRKYHGLLVANLKQPAGCFLLLSHLEDWVEFDGRRHDLCTSQYGGGTFSPGGHARQTGFSLELAPAFTYQCGALTVTRRVMMLRGQDAVLIRYDAEGPASARAVLGFRPMLAFRNVHQVTHANGTLNGGVKPLSGELVMRPYAGLPPLHLRTVPQAEFEAAPQWYFNYFYSADAERGFDHSEDLFTPGVIRAALAPGKPLLVAVSTAALKDCPAVLWTTEEDRRRRELETDGAGLAAEVGEKHSRLLLALRRSARQFLIVHPQDGPALHAGYHWFGPWGRDTLIALPGIAFLDGEHNFGVSILKTLARYERRGLLPNFINPDGTGAYTAADPSLWFFWTVQQYLASGGSIETVRREFWPTMRSIVRHYLAGTDNGISVDGDGLVRAGAPGTAVTWMDAQVGGRPIIPRWGYMVELNALWYNALCFTRELATRHFNENLDFLDSDFETRVRHAFVQKFWMPDNSGLYDVVNEFTSDSSLRPNALLAVSLPHSPLAPEQQRTVFAALRRELLTPFGLRSLTPNDMRYRGVCQGENWVRELAYHQGSVWPWFLAHFAEALFRVEGRTPATESVFDPVLDAFDRHLTDAGVGSISEVFDGDDPHSPRGAVSQAWNVAEVLRLLHLLAVKPAAAPAPVPPPPAAKSATAAKPAVKKAPARRPPEPPPSSSLKKRTAPRPAPVSKGKEKAEAARKTNSSGRASR